MHSVDDPSRVSVHAATAESPFSGHDSFTGVGASSHTKQKRDAPRVISSGDPMQQAALGISFG